MMKLSFPLFVVICLAIGLSGCMPKPQFYWGEYENSLFQRYQQAGTAGEARASSMLAATLAQDPTSVTGKVGPGIHADYGYLLFKQGRPDEAIVELQKEAMLFPESKPLMDTIISRIKERKNKDQEKKPAP